MVGNLPNVELIRKAGLRMYAYIAKNFLFAILIRIMVKLIPIDLMKKKINIRFLLLSKAQ